MDSLMNGDMNTVETDMTYSDYWKEMAQFIDYDPNEIVLTAEGNYFSSFKINGVEQAQPIQDVETEYGPVWVENKAVKYTAGLKNPLRVLVPGMKLKLQRPVETLKGVLVILNGLVVEIQSSSYSDFYGVFENALQEDKQTLVLDEDKFESFNQRLLSLGGQAEFFPIYGDEDEIDMGEILMEALTKYGVINMEILYGWMQQQSIGQDILIPIDVEYSYTGYDFTNIELPFDDVCYAKDIVMHLTEPLSNDTKFVTYKDVDYDKPTIGELCGLDHLELIGLTPMDDTMMNFVVNPAVFEQYNLLQVNYTCRSPHKLDFRFKNGDDYIQYKWNYSIGGVPKYIKVGTEPQVYNVTCKIADTFYVENQTMENIYLDTNLNATEGYSMLPYLSPYAHFDITTGVNEKQPIFSCIESITLPSGITYIPALYFASAPIRTINMPSTITEIGGYSFAYCLSLTEIVIPDSVITIGHNAFMYCGGLTSVTIPDNVKNIHRMTFAYCTSLTSVTIGSGVTRINSSVFEGCTSLTEVVIPDSVTEIGSSAFEYCSGLTSITIPDSVTSISNEAFSGCSSLTEIICYAEKAPSAYYAFDGLSINGVLKVPSGSDYSSWLNRLPSGWTIEYM